MKRLLDTLVERFDKASPRQDALWLLGVAAIGIGCVGIVVDPGFGGNGQNDRAFALVDPSGWFNAILLAVGLLLIGSHRYSLGSRRTSALLTLVLATLAFWGCLSHDEVAFVMDIRWGNVGVLGLLAVLIARTGLRGFLSDDDSPEPPSDAPLGRRVEK